MALKPIGDSGYDQRRVPVLLMTKQYSNGTGVMLHRGAVLAGPLISVG